MCIRDSSMGILNLQNVKNLDTIPEFKIICISVLKEEINHNLLSLLCCNPKYLFLPIIPVALILCPFAFFFSILLGIVFLVMAPLALLCTLLGLWFRKWMVSKCLNRARRKILKLTSTVIECNFSFKFFSDDDSDGGNLISFGNYVKITCHPDKLDEYELRNRNLKEKTSISELTETSLQELNVRYQ